VTVSLDALNALPEPELARRLRDCCGSTRWIARMLQERPFRSAEHLLTAAAHAWSHAAPEDWQEAFDHHPRIGEQRPQSAVSAQATAWSTNEQALAAAPNTGVRQALARANAEYERRFGRIYIVCAAGLEAEEILADVRRRLANEPEVEERIAAAEQARITALRLRQLIGYDP
jgi:2-oxo-4-hydroxy-4-carboxy-5-ureidoimidazoline decarboxylase